MKTLILWFLLFLYGAFLLVSGLFLSLTGTYDVFYEPIAIVVFGGISMFFGVCGIAGSDD